MMMAQKRKFLIVPGTCTHHSLLLLDKNILPPHLHASAGMNLQTNYALGEFRRRVAKLHDLHAVELRHNVIALRGYFEVVPLTRLQCPLAFCCGHRYPTAASAFIQPASVLAHARVHLRLHSFNIRTVFRIDARDARVKKHAAVARGLALELKSQMEVAIRFL